MISNFPKRENRTFKLVFVYWIHSVIIHVPSLGEILSVMVIAFWSTMHCRWRSYYICSAFHRFQSVWLLLNCRCGSKPSELWESNSDDFTQRGLSEPQPCWKNLNMSFFKCWWLLMCENLTVNMKCSRSVVIFYLVIFSSLSPADLICQWCHSKPPS